MTRKIKCDGLHTNRLTKEAGNPREVAFSEEWKSLHEFHDHLAMLMQIQCDRNDPERIHDWGLGTNTKPGLGEITDRDRIIAGTIAQWLGSNVGMSFIKQSLKRCGYRIERKG